MSVTAETPDMRRHHRRLQTKGTPTFFLVWRSRRRDEPLCATHLPAAGLRPYPKYIFAASGLSEPVMWVFLWVSLLPLLKIRT
jgi:hypothetical protein